jgi:hypothetical protein
MVMVRDDCLFVDVNGKRCQQTNNHLSPLPSTNKQSSLTITIKKQTVISHHYHQQINNHLSPLTSTNIMVREDFLFVDFNGER